jgi:hypothetical protein
MYTPMARYGDVPHAWTEDSGGAVQVSNASPVYLVAVDHAG